MNQSELEANAGKKKCDKGTIGLVLLWVRSCFENRLIRSVFFVLNFRCLLSTFIRALPGSCSSRLMISQAVTNDATLISNLGLVHARKRYSFVHRVAVYSRGPRFI